MISHNSKITLDGLELYCDATNPKSFEGEATTNLANTSAGVKDWTIGNLVASVSLSTVTTNSVYRITSGSTAGSFRFYFNVSNLTDGETYTMSFRNKIISSTGGVTPNFTPTDWNDQSITKTQTLNNDHWYHTATGSRSTYTNTYRFMDFYITANTVVEIYDIQLEEKDHATPYVAYQRNTWKDLTKNGYDLNFVSGTPEYSSTNNAVSFRSADTEYSTATIDKGILKDTNELGEWSLECLFKQISDSNANEAVIIGRGGHHGGILVQTNHIRHQIRTVDGSTGQLSESAGNMTNGNWYHSVMTYENGLVNSYLNGVLVSSDQFDKNTYNMRAYDNTLYVGGIGSRYPNIDLSLVRAYSKALNSSEVLTNYHATKGRMI